MTQLVIELDDSTLHRLEEAARKALVSASDWARKRLEAAVEPIRPTGKGWPEGYFERLAEFDCEIEEPPDYPLDPIEPLKI